MRFRRVSILRNGFGARPILAVPRLISIILVNAITVNAQVAPPGHAARPEALVIPEHNYRRQRRDPIAAPRIIPLLAELADQASLSGELNRGFQKVRNNIKTVIL